MDLEAKRQYLDHLIELRKAERLSGKLPNYWLNKEISKIKDELGIEIQKPKPKTTKLKPQKITKAKKKPPNKTVAKKKPLSKKPKPYPLLKGFGVAVDVQVGNNAIEFLKEMGLEVLVRAEPGEADEDWVGRALDLGVDIIVSDDKQVQASAQINGILSVPTAGRDQKGHRLYRSITGELLDYMKSLLFREN